MKELLTMPLPVEVDDTCRKHQGKDLLCKLRIKILFLKKRPQETYHLMTLSNPISTCVWYYAWNIHDIDR